MAFVFCLHFAFALPTRLSFPFEPLPPLASAVRLIEMSLEYRDSAGDWSVSPGLWVCALRIIVTGRCISKDALSLYAIFER